MATPEAILDVIDDTYRDHKIKGVPASGFHKPHKSDIRGLLRLVVGLAAASVSGRAVSTVADLADIVGPEANDSVMVVADPLGDVENGNGIWSYDGVAEEWVWLAPLMSEGVFRQLSEMIATAIANDSDWIENPDIEVLGDKVMAAITGGGDNQIRWAIMESGRILTQRQSNLFHDDPVMAGGLVLSNMETAAFAVPRTGSGLSPTIRGLPQPAGLPSCLMASFYGQSNAGGAQAGNVSSPTWDFGDYSMGGHIQTWARMGLFGPNPEDRPDASLGFVRLIERDDQIGVRFEYGAHGVSAGLKLTSAGGRFLRRNMPNAGPHLVFHCASTGGIYLDALLPGAGTGHYETLIDDIGRAKAEAARWGLEDFAHGLVIFDQGEAESDLRLTAGGSVLTRQQVIDGWVANFEALRTAAMTDVKAITGQDRVLWMMTQTPMGPAAEAQMIVADTYDDCFLACPRYQMPSALNAEYELYAFFGGGWIHGDPIHMAADGQLWRGEIVGRIADKILREGQNWTPLQPIRVWRVDGTTVRAQFHVPVPPLRISDIAQVALKTRGFEVLNGTPASPGSAIEVTSWSVVSEDTVEVTLASTIGTSDAFLRYGRQDWIDNIGPITAVRSGAAYASGVASTEYVTTGDTLALVQNALGYGAVILRNSTGSAVVRDAYLEGGDTVLRGWTADRASLGVLTDPTTLARDNRGGNLHDSDDALSVFSFAGAYGNRQGQPYPLNNHCVVFLEPIE